MLTEYTKGILDHQLVQEADIQSAAFSIDSGPTGAGILVGDFGAFPAALLAAVEDGEATRSSYRGIDVFIIPRYYDLYLAMPDSRTLVLAMGKEEVSQRLVEETLDLRLDGPVHRKGQSLLSAMLTAIGPAHFLFARRLTQDESQELVFFAGGGTLNRDASVDLVMYFEWVDEEVARRLESTLPDFPLYGYRSGEHYPFTEIERNGAVIVAEAESVLDQDVEGILLGN
ncbi:MAG: hypothetical protein OXR67_08155 [Chloroflexota bacterium]|nr:hypothetical protein [Chloroflexota bacterium]